MYDEWDPYLWDVIVENNQLLDFLDFKGIGKPAYNSRTNELFKSDTLNTEDIDELYK